MSPIGQLRIRTGALGAVVTLPSRSSATAYVVGSALFMSMLDASIVAAALPAMSSALHANPLDMSVVITASLLAMIVTVPASAWLADRFGARASFLVGIALFTLSSLVCGLLSSLPLLVVARLVQGIGQGLMATVGRVLVLRNSERSQFVNALSFLAMPALLAPVIGPPLGGLLIVYGSWRLVFLINVPVGLMALLATMLLVERDDSKAATPFDMKGFLLAASALACLVFGLQSFVAEFSFPVSATLLVVGAAAAVGYVWHARKHPHPVLDLALFRIRTFFIAVAAGNLGRLSLGAMPMLLMLLLQVGFGLDALQAGSIAFTTALGSLSVKLIVGKVAGRFGFRRALLVTSLLCGALIAGCALLRASVPHAAIAVGLLVIGFVRSLNLTLANSLSYADVPETRIADATSLATTAQYVAMAAGVALATVVMKASAMLGDTNAFGEREIDAALVTIGVLFAASCLLFGKLRAEDGASLRPADKARRNASPPAAR